MLDLTQLGFTQEELQQRVVDQICQQLMSSPFSEHDDGMYVSTARFEASLQKKIKEQIDASVAALAEQHVLPKVSDYIENLTLQETNKWGEKTGQSITFIEYLVKRAESYMLEIVSTEGKSRDEASSSYGSWHTSNQTRIAYLIHQHLHSSIETAMKQSLASANSVIVEGLEKTVKMKLDELAKTLKVAVTPK